MTYDENIIINVFLTLFKGLKDETYFINEMLHIFGVCITARYW